jgi:hypothetical protein
MPVTRTMEHMALAKESWENQEIERANSLSIATCWPFKCLLVGDRGLEPRTSAV